MSHEQPADDSPKPRRWLTFSLAGLMTFTALACVGFAWFGFHWRPAEMYRPECTERPIPVRPLLHLR
ncbi:MAG: hypothetical protein N2C14_30605 [Planctomycetales bacterium]